MVIIYSFVFVDVRALRVLGRPASGMWACTPTTPGFNFTTYGKMFQKAWRFINAENHLNLFNSQAYRNSCLTEWFVKLTSGMGRGRPTTPTGLQSTSEIGRMEVLVNIAYCYVIRICFYYIISTVILIVCLSVTLTSLTRFCGLRLQPNFANGQQP